VEGERAVPRHGSLTWDVTLWGQAIKAQMRNGQVIVGVGPADILPLALASHGEGEPLRTQVDLVQPLARQKILELKVDDLLLKVVVPGTFQVQAGEMLDVVMPSRALHLFDPLTEKAILLY